MTSRSYSAETAECCIYAYKEGVLSAMAHDLRLRVTRFELMIDDEAPSVSGWFDTASLRVVSAMKDGREAPDTLSRSHFPKIEANIVDDVLHPRKYPRAEFRSKVIETLHDRYSVRGALTLHGTTHDLTAMIDVDGDAWVAKVGLHQPDYGIRPFSAMLGTLRIKPEVHVVLRVPRT